MNEEGSKGAPASAPAGLPHEPGSASELLASTHLFTAAVTELDAAPWAVGADGLEHRVLAMKLSVVEIFKGTLSRKAGETFALDVTQHREGELVESDYHGLWSHESPAVGARYLVVAASQAQAPADLMKEGPCKALIKADRAGDVRLALEGEALFAEQRRGHGPSPELAAAKALLEFTDDLRGIAKDVYGRYLWARVQPVLVAGPDRPLAQVLDLIADDATSVELRGTLVEGLYEAALLLEPAPDVTVPTARALLRLLVDDSARPLRHRLLQVSLYNLIVGDGARPKLAVSDVVPDAAERATLRAAVAGERGERAQKLAAWLSAP